MKLRPVHDKIVVRQIEQKSDEVTASGIILPDSTVQGKLIQGEVLAAGKMIYSTTGDSIPIVVEVGDIILYSKQNGAQEYNLNGETVLIMSQNEVLSILEGK
jgi:co-chaperonin GroES (HSP10)|tara:strand:+ start:742 stop:1047 length:306 start_codon:yes stop_codon:yes gene_type:complete